MKYRIQIITAISNREREAKTEAALVTKALRDSGYYVVNPFEICAHIDEEPQMITPGAMRVFSGEVAPILANRRTYKEAYWHECMKECLDSLCYNNIDLALVISDVSNSTGAQIELLAARKFNIATYQRHTEVSFLPFFGSATMIEQVIKTLEGARIWEPTNV